MSTIFKSIRDTVIYAGQSFDRKFNLDDPTRLLNYRKAFYCLSDSPKCTEVGINPEKGLLIQGSKGVGKTMLMRVMQRLFKETPRKFKWVKVVDIIDLLRSEEFTEMEIKAMYGKGLKMDLYIDDIGFAQSDINRFGSYVNIIAEIVYDRYELYQDTNKAIRTHFTTNIRTNKDPQFPATPSLEALYGDRVLDRLKEMTNLIVWEGKSLRA